MLRSVSLGAAVTVAAAILLAGCSSDADRPVFRSGWLGPLASLESVPGGGTEGVYVHRGKDGNPPLDSVYLASVQVTVAPGSNLAAIDADDARAMREMLEARIRTLLDDRFRLTEGRRPSGYTLRVALTNVMVRRARDSGLRIDREDLRFGFAGATIESELRDGRANARRAATFARLSGSSADGERWAEIGSHFDAAVARLAEQLGTARTALAAPPPKPEQDR